ncbi:hypothetical protein ACJROX_06190 [Pseudalkalibacillus sp. A8]|uniref:hypothetical protein n=1 Tax=Pseudalkalibacillus sp. A8 TaxID=3382641 RepID=UPI0038B4A268
MKVLLSLIIIASFVVLSGCGTTMSEESGMFTFETEDTDIYQTVTMDRKNGWSLLKNDEEVATVQYIKTEEFDSEIVPNFEGGLHADEIKSGWYYNNTRLVLEHVKSMDVAQRFHFLFPVDDEHSYLLISTTPTLEKHQIEELAQSFRYD